MKILSLFLLLFAAINLSACGTKGSLKTPTQVEQEKAKKAKKEADKKKAEEEKAATPPAEKK